MLQDVARFVPDYAARDWDVKMAKAPTVISYAQAGLKPRDLMLGVHMDGTSRAFPYVAIRREKVVQDYIGAEQIVLVLGPDGQSVRVFQRRIPGIAAVPQFCGISADPQTGALLMDAESGSQWNFKGCAVAGRLKGVCLRQVEAIKDYWFDSRNYNAAASVYGIRQQIRALVWGEISRTHGPGHSSVSLDHPRRKLRTELG